MYGNRKRISSSTGKALLRARGERVERSFTRCLDRGGMRRVHLRGLANVGILLRALFGVGTPRGWADAGAGLLFARIGNLNLLILVIWLPNTADTPDCVMMVISRWHN